MDTPNNDLVGDDDWFICAMEEIQKLRALLDETEAKLSQAEQLVAKLETALATAQHALVVWDMAHRTGRNEPLIRAFETGVAALTAIRALEATASPSMTTEGKDNG